VTHAPKRTHKKKPRCTAHVSPARTAEARPIAARNDESSRGFPSLSEALAELSMRAALVRASRRLLAPEAVIALLGLGSLTLGGCMRPVRSQFEDARLAPGLYDADRHDANGDDTAAATMPSDAPNQSGTPNQSGAPCRVIPPLADE